MMKPTNSPVTALVATDLVTKHCHLNTFAYGLIYSYVLYHGHVLNLNKGMKEVAKSTTVQAKGQFSLRAFEARHHEDCL